MNNEQLNILDLLNILSFAIQLNNISQDNEQNQYIDKIIKTIMSNIEQLHQENQTIIQQNKYIIELLGDKTHNGINEETS